MCRDQLARRATLHDVHPATNGLTQGALRPWP